jgi:hypothetical protein
MYANILIPSANKATVQDDAVFVPVSSIIHKDQLTGLYTVDNNLKALLRWVRLGKTIGDQVEVLTGLSKEETYINHADGNLYNGASVKINN